MWGEESLKGGERKGTEKETPKGNGVYPKENDSDVYPPIPCTSLLLYYLEFSFFSIFPFIFLLIVLGFPLSRHPNMQAQNDK